MPIVTGYIGPIHHRDLRRGGRRTVQVAEPADWRVQRFTALELIGFVTAVVDGKIFLAQYVEPFDDNIGCVFPGLELLRNISLDARREIGTIYEFRDQAVGRARNGQPTFTGCRYVHREDWAKAREMIAVEILRRKVQR